MIKIDKNNIKTWEELIIINQRFIKGEITNWFLAGKIQAETKIISDVLCAINEKGLYTTNSQPYKNTKHIQQIEYIQGLIPKESLNVSQLIAFCEENDLRYEVIGKNTYYSNIDYHDEDPKYDTYISVSKKKNDTTACHQNPKYSCFFRTQMEAHPFLNPDDYSAIFLCGKHFGRNSNMFEKILYFFNKINSIH